MESFTLARTGMQPLKFRGELVAESDGFRTCGRENNRWHNIDLYRIKKVFDEAEPQLPEDSEYRYIAAVSYRSRYQGELDRNRVYIAEDAAAIASLLRGHNPTEYVVGFPTGDAYEERQARLHLDIRNRFEAQVSEILAGDEFAEVLK